MCVNGSLLCICSTFNFCWKFFFVSNGLWMLFRFGDFAVILVKDMILPNCIWKAGQTAAAFRTLAVSCLWSLLKHKLLTAEQV